MTSAAPAPPAAVTTTIAPHTHTHTQAQIELAWRPAKTATQIFNADSTAYAIVTGAQWDREHGKVNLQFNKMSTLYLSFFHMLSATRWLPNS